jgi:hypothetical protein
LSKLDTVQSFVLANRNPKIFQMSFFDLSPEGLTASKPGRERLSNDKIFQGNKLLEAPASRRHSLKKEPPGLRLSQV